MRELATPTIDPAELQAVLNGIEHGQITITPDQPADQVYMGNVTYHASNGWTIIVYNDCGEWDYLDSVTTPDGRHAQYPDATAASDDDLGRLFEDYMPPEDVIRDIYGFRWLD